MTRSLQDVFAMAARLTPEQQDALAALILAGSRRSPSGRPHSTAPRELGRLAREAVEEYRAGRTEPLDPDTV